MARAAGLCEIIHRQNLINYGVLPLVYTNPTDHERLQQGDVLNVRNLHQTLKDGGEITVEVEGKDPIATVHHLTAKQIEVIVDGGSSTGGASGCRLDGEPR